MKYTRNIFAVSIMALMAVSTARAEVVATTLLNKRLDELAKTIPAAANNATLTIQKNGTTLDTFTANASANKTINITVPTKVSDLTDASNFATTTAVNAKVSTNQGTANAGKGLVVNSAGNLELQNIATQDELNAVSGKIPANIANMEVTTNKVTDAKNFNNDLTSTTKYPSMAVAQAIVDQSTETITANVAAAQAAADEANDSISAMTLEGQTGNGVIKTVTQAGGKVSATRETIVNADIATNAAIDQSKVSGLVDALAGKQASLGYTAENSANKVTSIASTSTDTQYPSAKAVYTELAKKQNTLTIDSALSSTSTNPVQNKVVNTALNAKQNANTAVTHTASTAAGSATVPVYVSTTGVATPITSYSGNAATATTATNAKKICSGSACTSFVDIWVE